MIPEPLKDKCSDIDHPTECQEGCSFSEEDIKSAVEWLRKELCIINGCKTDHCRVCRAIDKAFEDVVKK